MPAVGVPPYGRTARIAFWTPSLCACSCCRVAFGVGKAIIGPSHGGANSLRAPTAMLMADEHPGMSPLSGNLGSLDVLEKPSSSAAEFRFEYKNDHWPPTFMFAGNVGGSELPRNLPVPALGSLSNVIMPKRANVPALSSWPSAAWLNTHLSACAGGNV